MQIERNTVSERILKRCITFVFVWCAFSRAFPPGGWGAQLLRRYDADSRADLTSARAALRRVRPTASDLKNASTRLVGLPTLVFLLNPNEPVQLYRFVWVEQKYECGGPNSSASFGGQILSTSAGHAPSSWPCPRAIRVSIRPKLTEELRPPAPRRESARKRTPYKDEGYAPFQDPFPTLWISQFASFAHFFCWIVLPRAPSTSMQVPGTFCQRLRFSIFAQPKRTCRILVCCLRSTLQL